MYVFIYLHILRPIFDLINVFFNAISKLNEINTFFLGAPVVYSKRAKGSLHTCNSGELEWTFPSSHDLPMTSL